MVRTTPPDKFERWLEKFHPEHLGDYERGVDKGDIDIVETSYGWFHLYIDGKLLGTLVT